MSLTLSDGPLAAGARTTINYKIEGPRHSLLLTPFPRRLRAIFADETLVDSDNAMLLYESNILPALYVPVEDVRFDLLTKTNQSTHCPFKGDASYWTITAGGRTSENSVWGYESPVEGATWLEGYVAYYWDHLDKWFDESEEVFHHLRDPYHRVDVRQSSRTVNVSVAGTVVAKTDQAKVLSETGFPNRFYIPVKDIKSDLFDKSETTTHCPYKGDTEYWSLNGDSPATDVAWSYPLPFPESAQIAGHWSFDGDDVTIETV